MATTPKESGGREKGLERDKVVRAALQLLNEQGFGGLTLRKLADRLQVKAAALYWHFENKQDLIDAMAEEILISEIKKARPKSKHWRDLLIMMAYTHRAALLRYRDGAQVVAHATMRQRSMLDGMELMLSALVSQGFSSDLALSSIFTVVRYTLGCVFEEQADPRPLDERLAERAAHWKVLAEHYPLISKTYHDVMASCPQRPELMFDLGLELILNGVAQRLPAA